jgi:serine-type D-Ala-D-Ala carboxypeptidase (penicillin-binding protein 5/6)
MALGMKAWLAIGAIVAVAIGAVAALLLDPHLWQRNQVAHAHRAQHVVVVPRREPRPKRPAPFALRRPPRRLPVRVAFARPPEAGILFDVDTGRVLWERHPGHRLPIASLTKMMTALIVAHRDHPSAKVRIDRHVLAYQGSGMGVLKKGERVLVRDLFYGLLLVSGNDAAIALAEHDSGSVTAFVDRMNRWARRLGLGCSHFSTPSGILDRDNYSCPRDLAALARADLATPRIARVVRRRQVRFPFPVKGGYLDLYNNNPFIYERMRGVNGLKTGYTVAAGRCYVTTQRSGGHELGVVLLNTPNPLDQVPALLHQGARIESSGAR